MKNTKTYNIKHQGWHTVTLAGNLMTGDTYSIKNWIRKYLGGKWDGQNKGWVVDLDLVAKYTTGGGETLMVK